MEQGVRRVSGHIILGWQAVLWVDCHSKRQRSWATVCLLVHEIAPAADRLPDQDGWYRDIGKLKCGQLVPQCIDHTACDRADQRGSERARSAGGSAGPAVPCAGGRSVRVFSPAAG